MGYLGLLAQAFIRSKRDASLGPIAERPPILWAASFLVHHDQFSVLEHQVMSAHGTKRT